MNKSGHRTNKSGLSTFVPGDEFVGESEAGHEAAFLEPKDGGERTREEDAYLIFEH